MYYIWPIALVVIANTLYQVCAKSVPETMNPFASLIFTYITAAVFTAVLYFSLSKDTHIGSEISKLNWAPIVLGFSIVCLEVGFIYAYKAGWSVSTASIVQSGFLAVALLLVGAVFYKESISFNKIIGIVLCLAGLYMINRK